MRNTFQLYCSDYKDLEGYVRFDCYRFTNGRERGDPIHKVRISDSEIQHWRSKLLSANVLYSVKQDSAPRKPI